MPPAPATTDWTRLRRRRVGPFIWLLLLVQAVTACIWVARLIPITIDLSFPEGALVERALAVAQGDPLYTDWREWPHLFAPYAPLTYEPVGWIARLWPEPSGILVTRLGRDLSLLGLIGIVLTMMAIARRVGMGVVWGVVAIAMLTAWLALLKYCISYRPDAPAAGFALAALVPVVGGPPRRRGALVALALLMISMWFKPAAWGVIAVVGWWLIAGWGWRRAAVWLGVWGAAGLAMVMVINWATGGLFVLNLRVAPAAGWSPDYLLAMASQWSTREWWLCVLGAVASTMVLARREGGGAAWLARASLVTFAVSLVLCLKIGSDLNYFLLPFPLLTLSLAEEAARLWRGETRLPRVTCELICWCVVLPLTLQPLITNLSALRGAFNIGLLSEPLPVIDQLRGQPGPILTSHPFIPAQLGRHDAPMDYFAYTWLVRRGLLDPAPLKRRIEEQAFPAMVIDVSNWNNHGRDDTDSLDLFFPGWYALASRYYTPVGGTKIYYILRPIRRPPESHAAPQ